MERTKCEISPQCNPKLIVSYRLGWLHGQIDLIDTYDGTPCRIVKLEAEIERLKTKPIKASKAFDYMPRDELIIIAEALDSLFMGDKNLEKQRAKMLKQAKHILRVRHGLGQ